MEVDRLADMEVDRVADIEMDMMATKVFTPIFFEPKQYPGLHSC